MVHSCCVHALNVRIAGWLRSRRGPDSFAGRSSGARAPPGVAGDWSHLGWKRSVADRQRRNTLFYVSAALCRELQRFLLAAHDRAVAADATWYGGRAPL